MLAGFAGHPLAGLLSFAPETGTTDHGFVHRNRCLPTATASPPM
ncbi:hypothetical protein N7U49_00975 [Streptomyces sp. AD2-2]|nr:hypothetical protein N7U49_00975 [Streptomyces sp. AD2-2]